MKGMKWIELILGLWVLASPWVMLSSLKMSNIIVGILIALIVLVELFGSKKTQPQM